MIFAGKWISCGELLQPWFICQDMVAETRGDCISYHHKAMLFEFSELTVEIITDEIGNEKY